MGRAFEYRKARKLKRWGNMSRTFTKIGKEITIAVKAAGPDPAGNSRLRVLLQNAKAANMPKDTVERAIKKATDKDASDYKEIVYEGYGPYGIAIVVEAATDNNTRTVANVRSYFNKFGGSLGTTGSLSFLFDHNACSRWLTRTVCLWKTLNWSLSTMALTRLTTRTMQSLSMVRSIRLPTFRNILRTTVSKSRARNSSASLMTIRRLLPSSANR